MNKVTEFIRSGILELYVVGQTTPEESNKVARMAVIYPEVQRELDEISLAFEYYAASHAVIPDPSTKAFTMATVDYATRLEQGEQPAFPPVLQEGAQLQQYAEWLSREDLQTAPSSDEISARIIGYTPEVITAIIWLVSGASPEIHTKEYEKFLIIEGSCDITIGDQVHHMSPGDYLTIPLHISHQVEVTSPTPCKILLQRVAA